MTDTRPYIDQERSVTDHWSESHRGPRATITEPAQARAIRTGNPHALLVPVSPDGPRRLAQPATLARLFLRFDATHDLPHIVQTEAGRIVARFEKAGDVASFVGADGDRKMLPEAYVMQLTGGQ